MRLEIGARSKDPGCRNDCTVRAIANGFGLSYNEAAALAKRSGRKRKNSGMAYPNVLQMLSGMPCKRIVNGDLRFGRFGRRTMSVLYDLDDSKSYIVMIARPGHAFAVVNGTVLDFDSSKIVTWTRTFGRSPVLGVWEVIEGQRRLSA